MKKIIAILCLVIIFIGVVSATGCREESSNPGPLPRPSTPPP